MSDSTAPAAAALLQPLERRCDLANLQRQLDEQRGKGCIYVALPAGDLQRLLRELEVLRTVERSHRLADSELAKPARHRDRGHQIRAAEELDRALAELDAADRVPDALDLISGPSPSR